MCKNFSFMRIPLVIYRIIRRNDGGFKQSYTQRISMKYIIKIDLYRKILNTKNNNRSKKINNLFIYNQCIYNPYSFISNLGKYLGLY